MNAGRHQFIIDREWRHALYDLPDEIEAEQQRSAEMREWARLIVEQGVEAMPKRDYELYSLADWLDVSQQVIDDRDTTDFAFMLVRSEAYDSFCEWCSRDPRREDEDFDAYCGRFCPEAAVKARWVS